MILMACRAREEVSFLWKIADHRRSPSIQVQTHSSPVSTCEVPQGFQSASHPHMCSILGLP